MSRYYAITIQQSSGKMSTANYNRALDSYEKALNVVIFPRYFEYGGKFNRLHVHGLATQDIHEDPISSEAFKGVLRKNHSHAYDWEECHNKGAWLNYIRKDQPTHLPLRLI